MLISAVSFSSEVLAELEEKVKGKYGLAAQLVMDLTKEVLQICFLIEEELVKIEYVIVALRVGLVFLLIVSLKLKNFCFCTYVSLDSWDVRSLLSLKALCLVLCRMVCCLM